MSGEMLAREADEIASEIEAHAAISSRAGQSAELLKLARRVMHLGASVAERERAAEQRGWDAALEAHDRGETPCCTPQAKAIVRLSKIYGDGIREGREQAAQAIEAEDNDDRHPAWPAAFRAAARLARGSQTAPSATESAETGGGA